MLLSVEEEEVDEDEGTALFGFFEGAGSFLRESGREFVRPRRLCLLSEDGRDLERCLATSIGGGFRFFGAEDFAP